MHFLAKYFCTFDLTFKLLPWKKIKSLMPFPVKQ